MKYAIIGDIHSNIHAIRAALQEIEPSVDKIECLGDIVGYNAKPKECIRLIKNHPQVDKIVQGNHDMDSADFETLHRGRLMDLSKDAYVGIKYSSSLLSDGERKWLKSLPKEYFIEDEHNPFWISHYSPDMCTTWGYILSQWAAETSLKVFKKWGGDSKIFFFGHSHVPTVFKKKKGRGTWRTASEVCDKVHELDPDAYYLINPGSIGQARIEGLTSYALFDTEKMTLSIRSFQYNYKRAQKAVRDAGYSLSIASRLDPEYEKRKSQAQKARYKHQKAKTGREKWV